MAHSYNITTTSNKSAKVEDVWLAPPEDPDTVMTRKVARPELVDNAHSDEARVKITIVHQRRHKKNEPWQDYDTFNLATLKAGEEMKLYLNAFETQHLHQVLSHLMKITEAGVPPYDGPLTVVDETEAVVPAGRATEIVRQLLDRGSDDLWDALEEIQPQLFKVLALNKLHELREHAVEEFESHANADDWLEGRWQDFFERNSWIFGYGLTYRFLSTVVSQPHYGGTNVTGRGAQRGDFLAASEAECRFTVLVEIKRPNTLLVENIPYRNQAYGIGRELVGGVSQLQTNCSTWEIEGSRTDENREILDRQACWTIQPKGILVIGHTKQLQDRSKRATFERFRRNLHNPEVITFDELLARAKHLLLNEAKQFGDDGHISDESF